MEPAHPHLSIAPLPGSGLGWLRDFFLRTTPLRAAPAVGMVAAAASVLVTVTALLALFPSIMPMFWIGVALAIAIPMSIAPPIAWTLAHLLSELSSARRTVEKLAVTDVLTGASNRRHLHEVGTREVERARRAALPLSLLVLDLDNFKRINDLHGHVAGDAVLQAVGQICLAKARPYDLVARYGGEELVVLLPSTTPDEARLIAERLRHAIAALTVSGRSGEAITPTASIGVASLDAAAASLETLFEKADAAMYEAKRAGKNRVAVA